MDRQLSILLLLILFTFSCGDNLSKKKQTVRLQYVSWGCECANWAEPKYIDKYVDYPDSLAKLCVFIEPADNTKILPNDTVGYNGDLVEFMGSYYVDKRFPTDFDTKQSVEKAKVFRYEGYKIIRSNREAVIKETIDPQKDLKKNGL